jgi:hypothetical protein
MGSTQTTAGSTSDAPTSCRFGSYRYLYSSGRANRFRRRLHVCTSRSIQNTTLLLLDTGTRTTSCLGNRRQHAPDSRIICDVFHSPWRSVVAHRSIKGSRLPRLVYTLHTCGRVSQRCCSLFKRPPQLVGRSASRHEHQETNTGLRRLAFPSSLGVERQTNR